MYSENIIVENIKCGGCANSITKALKNFDGVDDVDINIETQEITIKGGQELNREAIINKLSSLGYPLAGHGNGLQKAKSFVSCMIGRVS
jgi:copper chaperone CopZ